MILMKRNIWSFNVMLVLFLIQDTHQVPITIPGGNIPRDVQDDDCPLPDLLDFDGKIRFLEECPSLNRYAIPIPIQPYGNVPRICCAKELGPNPICFPSDPWCPGYVPYDYDDYDYYDNGDQEDNTVSNVSFVCNINKLNYECVPLNSCGNVSSPETNKFCGFQQDQIKVCCQTDQIKANPIQSLRKPRFKNSGKPYSCQDKTPFCKTWAAGGACDLDRHFGTELYEDGTIVKSIDMFNFMMLTCQESCGWCGDKECVDELSGCESFARQGFCDRDTLFMSHTCRESCGQCGFLSSENTEEQKSSKSNSYTNMEDSSFDCGRYKALDELRQTGISVTQDEFPDKTALNDKGECDGDNTAITDQINERNLEDDGNDDIDDTTLGNTDSNATINCGLIIINDRWMLSAGHCYDQFQINADIRVSQVRAYLPDYKEFILQKRVFVHPGYELPKLYNDIALIELGRRIIFDFDVLGDTPTCLSSSFDFDEKIAAITGFGVTEEGTSGKLGTVNVTLTNYQTCNQDLSSYVQIKTNKREQFCEAMPYGILDQNICGRGSPLCSLGERVYPGSCKGDSGGPVEVEDNGKRTLVALVSGSINCNSALPEWYTRVAYFRDWIQCIVKNAQGNKLSQKDIEGRCKRFVRPLNGSKSNYCTNN